MDIRSESIHLRQRGQNQGPFDVADVRRWYDVGELGADVMSWRAGELRWQSLGRRWPVQRRVFRQWLVILAGLILVGLGALVAAPTWTLRLLPPAAQQPGVLWMLVSTLIGLAFAVIAVGSWRIRRRAQSPGLAYVLGCFVIVLISVIGFSLAKISSSLLAYRLLQDNALVSFNAMSHDIVIRGAIGPHLSSDLDSVIRAHPDALKILIRSQGGLVSDAFRAADVITAAHLPLEVVNYCASACVLLWATVPKREMSPGSRLGLHQNSLRFEFDPAFNVTTKQTLDARSFSALDHAGFSSRLQAARRATPPQKIFWVSVPEAKAEGVSFDLVAAPAPQVLY